ncbi:ribosomal RNA-processing protein 7 homolog A-like [Amphiura filiformis]|uniref:ribosomal RNA-processing protein 7 homolog A-like n=1 Tax=Amphiura filiformis TaxID=82378 RepID=UPI003B20C96F
MVTYIEENMAGSIAGFNVLPIRLNRKSQSGHVLYYKEHNIRGDSASLPPDRTIFVLNVPPYCNKDCFVRLFSDCGRVDSVYLQEKPTSELLPKSTTKYFSHENISQGFKVAYVVFKSPSAVEKAMNRKHSEPYILISDDQPALEAGYKKWCTEYKSERPNLKDLQKEIDEFMQTYDQKVSEDIQKAKEEEGTPDDEGWITVTRKGSKKQKPVARKEHIEKQLKAKEKKKREDKELVNFYTFQVRETKREHIAELRRKFEEDKHRIAQLRAARKFKPY